MVRRQKHSRQSIFRPSRLRVVLVAAVASNRRMECSTLVKKCCGSFVTFHIHWMMTAKQMASETIDPILDFGALFTMQGCTCVGSTIWVCRNRPRSVLKVVKLGGVHRPSHGMILYKEILSILFATPSGTSLGHIVLFARCTPGTLGYTRSEIWGVHWNHNNHVTWTMHAATQPRTEQEQKARRT